MSDSIISAYTYTVDSLGRRTSVVTEGDVFDTTPANWTWDMMLQGGLPAVTEPAIPTIRSVIG